MEGKVVNLQLKTSQMTKSSYLKIALGLIMTTSFLLLLSGSQHEQTISIDKS